MATLACAQFSPILGETDTNLASTLALCEASAANGANIIVLPELCTTGYTFTDVTHANALARASAGAALDAWGEMACRLGVVIVAGFAEPARPRPYNSAAILTPDGGTFVYRKAHLWDAERFIFQAGDDPPPVIATPWGTISPLICYDLEFPEWVRLPVLGGAQLLCVPANWPLQQTPEGEILGERIRAKAQAAMNRVGVAVCDRSGRELGPGGHPVPFTGGSLIVDQDGWTLAQATGDRCGGAQIIVADLDLAMSKDKRVGTHSDVLADRRPDIY